MSGKHQISVSASSRPRLPRWRIALRWCSGIVAVLGLTGMVTFWLITRPWFIIGQVAPELERKLGGLVVIGGAEYLGRGRISVSDVILRAPNVRGPGGEVVRIGRAQVAIDFSKLLTAGVRLSEVVLDDVVLRFSEDAQETGRLNVLALRPDWSGDGDSKPTLPPRVIIHQAALEFGTHEEREFRLRGRRIVSGMMQPNADDAHLYDYHLIETDEEGKSLGPGGINITGRWNVLTNEQHSRVDGLELDQGIYEMCPRLVRLWWDQMNLEGRVEGIALRLQPGNSTDPLAIELAIQDIALTLPIETDQVWARYREGAVLPSPSRPRMNVESGVIRLGWNSLELWNLVGTLQSTDSSAYLAAVPYTISLTIRSLPDMEWENREQWMEQVVKFAPFHLKFGLDQFHLATDKSGEIPAIDLPVLVAKALAKFQMTDWVVSSTVEVTRLEPEMDEAGNWIEAVPRTTGHAYIRNASGRYRKFPYRLDQVDAYLQFDNEKVIVHYLTGRGSGESTFRITGEIAPPDDDASFALRIIGANVPLDGHLREALRDEQQEAFDALLHRPAYHSLYASGLVSEETSPFELGGMVDLDLRVQRALGPDQPTVTTGTILVQSAGVVFKAFPYPLRITGGALELKADRVVVKPGSVNQGITFVTPGKGVGSITGEVRLPKDDSVRRVEPDLSIAVRNDSINDLAFAAIPLTEDEQQGTREQATWPGGRFSRAARLVRGLGLQGAVNYQGHIGTDESGNETFRFTVSMEDGTAQPGRELAEALGAPTEFWPANTVIAGVRGVVDVAHDHVEWENVVGRVEESEITASGRFDLGAGASESELTIDVKRLSLARELTNLFPEPHATSLLDQWSRYQPQGLVDARWEYVACGKDHESRLFVEPHELTVLIDSQPVTFKRVNGRLVCDESGVEVENLVLEISSNAQQADGILSMAGSYRTGGPEDTWSFSGRWDGGRLESPLTAEAVRVAVSEEQVAQFREYRAAGEFNAEFSLGTASAERQNEPFSVSLRPKNIAAYVSRTPIYIELAGGEVELRPGRVRFEDVRGRLSGGEFSLDGAIRTGDPIDVQLSLGYVGRLRSAQVEAFLPEVVRQSLEAIEFSEGEASRLLDGRLHLTRASAGEQASAWNTTFSARLETRHASFEAGTRFTDVDGAFDIDVRSAPGRPLRLSINANADRAVAIGQKLTNAEAPIVLSNDGEVIRVDALRADCGGGKVSAQVELGVGDRLDYQSTIKLVGVRLERVLRNSPSGEIELPEPVVRSDLPAHGGAYGSISISGNQGQAESRRGRGTLRIVGTEIASAPLALQIMKLLQLTLPFGGGIDFADVNMYIDGDRVIFERILLESAQQEKAMLQLIGEGEMDFNTLELDTRFHTRGGVVVVRDLIGGIGDRLFAIEVTGPLHDPQARIVPLPSHD